MPCPLTDYAHRVLSECDGDFVAARQRVCNIELCAVVNDTTGLVDIFDALAPSYGAQSVEGQACCLVNRFGGQAPLFTEHLINMEGQFPRKGLREAVSARLAFVKSRKAVRR